MPCYSYGFLYFVIFINAHTKHIWYYPLIAKSDVFSRFHCFQVFIERQFSCKIKFVQTDWGGEYRKLNSFIQTIDIHHKLICPYTHEQNSTIKGHHRYIVKTGLTLLAQCSAPLWFWNYVFESLIYLINYMPTLVLQNQSLFECLFHCTPDYDFLCTFGCLCFSFLRPYHVYKLDFYSSSYVFLGYSFSLLGYRCLDLASQRVYISRHVCFHENVFSFAKSEQITQHPPILSHPIQPTHLPTLNPSLNFHPTALPIHHTSSQPKQTTHQPTMSATNPMLPNPAPMSPSSCFSNDYFAGTASPLLELHFSRFVTVDNPGSTAGSPNFVVVSSRPQTSSSADLQLIDDLSSYPLY